MLLISIRTGTHLFSFSFCKFCWFKCLFTDEKKTWKVKNFYRSHHICPTKQWKIKRKRRIGALVEDEFFCISHCCVRNFFLLLFLALTHTMCMSIYIFFITFFKFISYSYIKNILFTHKLCEIEWRKRQRERKVSDWKSAARGECK